MVARYLSAWRAAFISGRIYDTCGIELIEYVNLWSAPKTEASEAVAANKCVLKFFANVSMNSDEIRCWTGKLFHVAGPDIANSRRRTVVLTPDIRGKTRVPLSDDRSCHLPTTAETRIPMSSPDRAGT